MAPGTRQGGKVVRTQSCARLAVCSSRGNASEGTHRAHRVSQAGSSPAASRCPDREPPHGGHADHDPAHLGIRHGAPAPHRLTTPRVSRANSRSPTDLRQPEHPLRGAQRPPRRRDATDPDPPETPAEASAQGTTAAGPTRSRHRPGQTARAEEPVRRQAVAVADGSGVNRPSRCRGLSGHRVSRCPIPGTPRTATTPDSASRGSRRGPCGSPSWRPGRHR